MRKFQNLFRMTQPCPRNEQILQLCAVSPEVVPVKSIIALYKSDSVTDGERSILKKLLINFSSEEILKSLEGVDE